MRNEAHRNTVVLFEINLKPKLNASNAVYKVYSQLLEDNNCKINENAFAIYSTIHFDCFYPAEGNAGMQSQPNIKAIEKPSFRKLGCFRNKNQKPKPTAIPVFFVQTNNQIKRMNAKTMRFI